MVRHVATLITALGLTSIAPTFLVGPPTTRPAGVVIATRLPQNPLVTVDSSPTLGDNVNGPTVVRVPPSVTRPLGRYYLYFAHHMGRFIRLAYADSIAGPWKVYDPGVLRVTETAFDRPQPDPTETLDDFYTHVASPEIYFDAERRRILLWFHGWWTEGRRWPSSPEQARAWARQHGYGQFTQVAESSDGLHFQARPLITRTSYIRVFPYAGALYGMARLGRLVRTNDATASWELGPNPFRSSPYAERVRHVAVVRRGQKLHVFFSAIGDVPERIMVSTIELTGDWSGWRAAAPVEVLRPETTYECGNLPNAPSEAGDVKGRVRQLRDPFVLEEGSKSYLFYTICGEQGIAAAELTIPE